MAPKPDQMQLEKQKTAAIQRTQHAAGQTQSMQQPVQQNAQTQQNAKQFWTADMELEEQIPIQQENLTEEMHSAYEKVHGEKMGKKQRVWRTERTTKKKRARGENLVKEERRYLHNRRVIDERSGMSEIVKDKPILGYYLRNWMDLSGTQKAEQFNRTLAEKLSGDRDAELEAIQMAMDRFDKIDLKVYADLSDEKIVRNYYELQDIFQKMTSIEPMYEYLLKHGGNADDEQMQRIHVKIAYFKQLQEVLEFKKVYMKNPYYSLLRTSDAASLSDEELKKRDGSTEGALREYYHTILDLRRNKKRFDELENPDAYLKDAKRLERAEKKVKNSKAKQEANQKRYERYEMEKQKDPVRAAALEKRRQLIDEMREFGDEWKMRRDNLGFTIKNHVPDYEKRRDTSAQRDDTMSKEELTQRYQNFASKDPKVKLDEYNKVIDEMLDDDLSQYHIETDDAALETMKKDRMKLRFKLDAYSHIWRLMSEGIKEGLQVTEERKQNIWKKYSFYCYLGKFYDSIPFYMQEDYYGETTPEQEPKTFEEAEKLFEEMQRAGQTSKMNYYHGFMERFKYMKDMGLENRSISLSEAFKKFDPGPVGENES